MPVLRSVMTMNCGFRLVLRLVCAAAHSSAAADLLQVYRDSPP